MSNLYVANCTKQHHLFTIDLPEKGVRQFEIPAGAQMKFADMSTGMIDDIVKHHSRYGLVRTDEIDRTKPFIGMCYSLDQPVPAKRILFAMEHNHGVLTEQGRRNRDLAVLGAQAHLDKNVAPGTIVTAEIQEEPKEGRPSPEVNETIKAARAQSEEGDAARGTDNHRKGKRGR